MSRISKSAFALFSMLLLSVASVYVTEIETTDFIKFEFVIGYIGVNLGFAITIYTFATQLISSIDDNIVHASLSNEDEAKFRDRLYGGFDELKQDIIVMVFCLVFSILITIFKSQCAKISILEHFQIMDIIIINALILCLFATCDMIMSLFNIAEISILLSKKKNKKK